MSRLRETDYLKAWALFTLCAAVGGFVVGVVVGIFLGAVLGALMLPLEIIKILSGAVGFLASLPISYLLFRVFVSRFIVQKLTSDVPITPAIRRGELGPLKGASKVL